MASSLQNPPSASTAAFLDALAQAEYGSLTLVTPEGETREFTGRSPGPAAHWRLHDWKVLNEAVARGEIGFAESYIQGRWDTKDLVPLIEFMLVNGAALEKFFHGKKLHALWLIISNWFHRNSIRGSSRNIQTHYDLGNDFYALWLDGSMTYSCGLFEGDAIRTLEQAQAAKYARILGKLNAKPGEHILEIGCGWGGFAETAARQGLKVTAITLSPKQAGYAVQRLERAGLSHLARIELRDYRHLEGQFDHIVSIGMFEHVGKQYWPGYFRTISERLKPGGKAMVQTITLDEKLFDTLGNTTGFIEKYIFPGGMLPSKPRFRQEAEQAGLQCRELFAFGQDYAQTLTHWLARFDAKLPEVKALGYDEQFIRLWRFYLTSCIAAFRSRRTDVMQAELTRV